jgi:hypothetical protein
MSHPENTFIKRFSLKPKVTNRIRLNCHMCDLYNGITQCNLAIDQRDKKRKDDVLQYKNNSMTKAEKYALIVRNNGQHHKTYASQTQTYTNHNSLGGTEISNVIKPPSCLKYLPWKCCSVLNVKIRENHGDYVKLTKENFVTPAAGKNRYNAVYELVNPEPNTPALTVNEVKVYPPHAWRSYSVSGTSDYYKCHRHPRQTSLLRYNI